jgi:hypothetical protein
VGRSDVGPHATHLLGIVVVSLRGASGNTLYWVLLLAYAGPRGTHLTGYCCWFDVGLRATHFNGYRFWFMSGPRQHTFNTGYCCLFMCLGQRFTGYCNAVGLCGASGNTPMLRILLVYVAPRIGQHTLLGIVVGL